MVGNVALLLTKHLADKNPACFIGCLGTTDEADVIAHKKELYEFAEMCGLCHDIGKTACIDNPYMHIRILTPEEFEIIKEHPSEGVKMMTREDGDTTNEGYIDVIAGHHKYYDNSAGYPEDVDVSKSKHKMMIDIIAVSNSLVSATDPISRTYTDIKSLESIREEIKAEAGTRYSPILAELLDDKKVFSEIKKLLEKESINAYYTAYLHAWSGVKH